ncbi:MAG: dipeptidase [Bacteroidetes bacterium]|nr:dipeptidase [Bacteroidota bacterium]
MKHTLYFYFLPLLWLGLVISCDNGGNSQNSSEKLDLEEKARELAFKYIITDGHVDLPYRLKENMEDISTTTEAGDFDHQRAKAGGLDAPFMSIYIPAENEGTGNAKPLADSLIDMVVGLTVDYPDKFALANTPEDIESNFQKGLISFPMGMENGSPIEGDIRNVQYFFDRGIRYITLTHSKDNHICDSSYDTLHTWNGLSPFGTEVVKEMNRLGMMIDVSHLSDSTFYQVMAVNKAPSIASHSSCRHFTPGWQRNMSDDMIKKLAENGGVIQINFGSTFLDQASLKSWEKIDAHNKQWLADNQLTEKDPRAKEYTDKYHHDNFIYTDITKVVAHIDHVVHLVGIDYVAFGSDFDGLGDSLPEGLKDVSQYPNLIKHLLEKGYSEEDIRKICYANVFRVWKQVIEVARESKT